MGELTKEQVQLALAVFLDQDNEEDPEAVAIRVQLRRN
jgi:hypothetical protein